MAFWWRRRRRFWYGPWRKRRYTARQTRRRRRFQRRRRRRRPTRRRRRRRNKVRRKRKTIPVMQWQPDSIVNCKIKGLGELVLGAEGTQYLCYTNEKNTLPPPLCPAGGGFGVERYNLLYLYYQHYYRMNIWTRTNTYKDLCRYQKCILTFYAHPKIDFIVQYKRQGPFNIDKYTYPGFHPALMLLSKHHRVIPSQQTNPKGKRKYRITIGPPKQMISKWFFQKDFCEYDLLQIAASACTLQYPRISSKAENRVITIPFLNPAYYQHSNWAQTINKEWQPYQNINKSIIYVSKYNKNYTVPSFAGGQEGYYESISRTKGWFAKEILAAYDTKLGTIHHEPMPVLYGRYNPSEDNGKGNEIYMTSVVTGEYNKPVDQVIIFDNTPLWLAFYGWWSYIKKLKHTSYFSVNMFIIKSPFIYKPTGIQVGEAIPFIDMSFVNGQNQKNSPYSYYDEKLWYPTAWRQIETINAIVESGPYIPKLSQDTESTWELPFKYDFRFKWGGPHISDQEVKNPKDQDTYDVPDTMQERIQISNPLKQTTESMLHTWDIRRGYITNTALKRMSENILTDTDFQTDSESSQKRKRCTAELHNPEEKVKKIKKCLLSLCESTTSQEEEEETPHNLLKLIHKQRKQQHLLKHNILTILQDMKQNQQMLQLQTGNLN
nr:MAG: ORF1 [Torque teno midi virus]